MNSSTVVSSKTFNVDNVVFDKVRELGKSKIAYIKYRDGSSENLLYLKTGELFAPFGISDYEGDKNYRIMLNFLDGDENIKHVFEQLDEKVKSHKDSKESDWKKKDTKNYSPMLKEGSDKEDENGKVVGKWPDSVQLKLSTKRKNRDDPNSQVLTTKFYDKKKLDLKIDSGDEPESVSLTNVHLAVPKGCKVKTLVHVASVWFVSGKYGVTLRVKQVMVPEVKREDDCYLSSEEEDNNEDHDEDHENSSEDDKNDNDVSDESE